MYSIFRSSRMCILSCISVRPSAPSPAEPSRGAPQFLLPLLPGLERGCLARGGGGQRLPRPSALPLDPLAAVTNCPPHCCADGKGKRGEEERDPRRGGQLPGGLWAHSVQAGFGGSCSPSCGRKRPFHSHSGPSPAPAHTPGRADREPVCREGSEGQAQLEAGREGRLKQAPHCPGVCGTLELPQRDSGGV